MFMKQIKIAIALIGFVALSALAPSPGKAQSKDKDPVVTVVQGGDIAAADTGKAIFNGSEHTLVDSLAAINEAIQDPQVQATVNKAIVQVANVPKAGATLPEWISYILGIIGVGFGMYHYLKKKWQSKPK